MLRLILHGVVRLLLRLLPRVRLPTGPIPGTWPGILESNVPFVSRLPPPDQERLHRIMLLFLQEVPMEGCRGLDLTEEIRVTIAAQACLLLLHMDYPRYLRVRRVLVYPSTFVPKTVKTPGTLEIHRPARPTLGEGWRSGVVVLSWDAVRHGASVIEDGRNVVLHEFAHMLDLEDSAFDGVPVFDTASAYRAWAAALALRFTLHVDATKRGRRRPIREYSATNRAEYFAVATEAFFEKPWQLRKREPELYTQLVDFFRQDPASYPSST